MLERRVIASGVGGNWVKLSQLKVGDKILGVKYIYNNVYSPYVRYYDSSVTYPYQRNWPKVNPNNLGYQIELGYGYATMSYKYGALHPNGHTVYTRSIGLGSSNYSEIDGIYAIYYTEDVAKQAKLVCESQGYSYLEVDNTIVGFETRYGGQDDIIFFMIE